MPMSTQQHSCEVVVVGAGLAGLSAAAALVDAGVDTLVLEARDRVGGRTHTEALADGTVIDLGGQWLGAQHDALRQLAEELGCETFPTYDEGDSLDVRAGVTHRFSGSLPRDDADMVADLSAAYAGLDALTETIDLQAPWSSPDAEQLDSATFATWIEQNVGSVAAKERLGAVTRAVWAAEPADVSLLHILFYARSNGGLGHLTSTTGGAQERRFAHGSQSVALGLAARLGDRVRLDTPVWTAQHDDAQVVVGAEGLQVTAGYAVLALPPTLAGQLRYDPALPPLRSQLTQRTPMGSVIKVFCSYPSPFWRENGLSGQVLSDRGPVRVVFDNSPANGSVGVLLGFLEGADARRWMGRPVEARRQAVIANLVTYFGDRADSPVEYREQTWAAEPYSGGCYAMYLPPGVWTSYGEALRAPVGRLHWAGSDIAVHSAGYMDGAVHSGRAAASAILALRP